MFSNTGLAEKRRNLCVSQWINQFVVCESSRSDLIKSEWSFISFSNKTRDILWEIEIYRWVDRQLKAQLLRSTSCISCSSISISWPGEILNDFTVKTRVSRWRRRDYEAGFLSTGTRTTCKKSTQIMHVESNLALRVSTVHCTNNTAKLKKSSCFKCLTHSPINRL